MASVLEAQRIHLQFGECAALFKGVQPEQVGKEQRAGQPGQQDAGNEGNATKCN